MWLCGGDWFRTKLDLKKKTTSRGAGGRGHPPLLPTLWSGGAVLMVCKIFRVNRNGLLHFAEHVFTCLFYLGRKLL